ncbi:MAG: ATP-binding protein [Clostridia bacterium]|nr:ATP-binding protein [Clostridia bacterium]
MKSVPSGDHLIAKMFFRLLPFQILMLIINAGNCIVDSLFASNVIGQTAMSAIGIYSPLDHFLYALSMMLMSGSQLLMGKRMGRNDLQSVHGIFSTDLIVSAVVSVITSLLLILAVTLRLTDSLVPGEEERTAVAQYMLSMSFGIPALVVGQQLFAFLSMENQTRRTTVASITCLISNTFLDYLLLSVLKMGVFGLGLGSAISYWIFFGVMAAHYFSPKAEFRFSPRFFDRHEIKKIIVQGYSGALSRFVEMFRCIIVNMLIIRYIGSIGLSAFAAVNSVMAVFWPLPFGIVSVCRMLLGVSIGEEDRTSITGIMRVAIFQGGLLQCCISALLVLLAVPIASLFYHNPADPVFGMTAMGFRMMPLCMPLAVFSLVFGCYAQSAGKKVLSTVLPITDGMVNVVVLSFFLIPAMGITGLYLANILNGFICVALIILFAWHKRKAAPRNLEDLLTIPDDFGVGGDQRIDIEVREMSEVINVSGRVIAFCRQRGIDSRRASFAGLALEEMAGNVVAHGFGADRRKHEIDIRVIHRDQDIILRLRDNCIAFNPSERVSMVNSEDPSRNVGIRLVYRLAKDVKYQNLLGVNVLTIVI